MAAKKIDSGSAALALVGDEPKLKPIDWSGAVDISTLTLPHMMAMNGGHGIVLGQSFAGGGNFSGLVKRMAKMADGVILIIIELGATDYGGATGEYGAFLFFGNGMYAEIDTRVYEPITEENSGPWQKPIGAHR